MYGIKERKKKKKDLYFICMEFISSNPKEGFMTYPLIRRRMHLQQLLPKTQIPSSDWFCSWEDENQNFVKRNAVMLHVYSVSTRHNQIGRIPSPHFLILRSIPWRYLHLIAFVCMCVCVCSSQLRWRTKKFDLVQMRVITRGCLHRVRLSARMDQRNSTNPNSTTTFVTAPMALMSPVFSYSLLF